MLVQISACQPNLYNKPPTAIRKCSLTFQDERNQWHYRRLTSIVLLCHCALRCSKAFDKYCAPLSLHVAFQELEKLLLKSVSSCWKNFLHLNLARILMAFCDNFLDCFTASMYFSILTVVTGYKVAAYCAWCVLENTNECIGQLWICAIAVPFVLRCNKLEMIGLLLLLEIPVLLSSLLFPPFHWNRSLEQLV